jgi:hypothetical protein
MMSGYNIYISREPLVDRYPGSELPPTVKPFNNVPFPGDTDPSDGIQHFPAEGLENGVKYYVSVRVVNTDRSLSKPSNEVAAVCGPRGEIELSMRFKSDHDGFSFTQNGYVRADQLDNDLYFHSKDGTDYLVSPHRLNGFLKVSKLYPLPFKGAFEDVKEKVAALELNSPSDKVAVKPGDWVLLATPDNKHALIKVLDVTGTGENRRIKLFYAYNPLPDELLF